METVRKQSNDVQRLDNRELLEIKNWLEDLEQEQDRLTEWEKNFVADMLDWFTRKGSLTSSQHRRLGVIHDRYF